MSFEDRVEAEFRRLQRLEYLKSERSRQAVEFEMNEPNSNYARTFQEFESKFAERLQAGIKTLHNKVLPAIEHGQDVCVQMNRGIFCCLSNHPSELHFGNTELRFIILMKHFLHDSQFVPDEVVSIVHSQIIRVLHNVVEEGGGFEEDSLIFKGMRNIRVSCSILTDTDLSANEEDLQGAMLTLDRTPEFYEIQRKSSDEGALNAIGSVSVGSHVDITSEFLEGERPVSTALQSMNISTRADGRKKKKSKATPIPSHKLEAHRDENIFTRMWRKHRESSLAADYGISITRPVEFWNRPVPMYGMFTPHDTRAFHSDLTIQRWSGDNGGSFLYHSSRDEEGGGELKEFDGIDYMTELIRRYDSIVKQLQAHRKIINIEKSNGKLIISGKYNPGLPAPLYVQIYSDVAVRPKGGVVSTGKPPTLDDSVGVYLEPDEELKSSSELWKYHLAFEELFGTQAEVNMDTYTIASPSRQSVTADGGPKELENWLNHDMKLPIAKRLYNLDCSITFDESPSGACRTFVSASEKRRELFLEHVKFMRAGIRAENIIYLYGKHCAPIKAAEARMAENLEKKLEDAETTYVQRMQLAKNTFEAAKQNADASEKAAFMEVETSHLGAQGGKGLYGEIPLTGGGNISLEDADVARTMIKLNDKEVQHQLFLLVSSD